MATLQRASRRSRYRKVLKYVAVFVVSWSILAWVMARALVVNAHLDHADAIVVLSGSSAYIERTQKAAELFRQRRAPVVLLTNDNTRGGWVSTLQRNPYFVERATTELIKNGVPREKIEIIPGLASSTHEEAVIVKNFALSKGLRSVLVVTSAYHSRRALRSLRRTFAGTETAVGLEPSTDGRSTSFTVFWWLQPQGWRTVGSEYLKLIYYWFKYD